MPYLLKANTPANEIFGTIFSETDDFDSQNLYSNAPTCLANKAQPLDMLVLFVARTRPKKRHTHVDTSRHWHGCGICI